MIMGVMVQDTSKKMGITQVIEEAMASYERRFGEKASVVEIHPCHSQVSIEGVEVRQSRGIFPSCALAGRPTPITDW